MPAPSKLSIATSSVSRLLKEEASYHKELEQQEAHVKQLEQDHWSADQNADFKLKQERKAIEETKAIFPPLRQRISAAAAQLERQLEQSSQPDSDAEIAKARDVLSQAKNFQ